MEATFNIGAWLVEPKLNRVSGPEGRVTLEPRTMKVLVLLARSSPEVVMRDELMDVVWEGSVVTEHSLTIAISDLRKCFGDDPKSPAVIETIRGVGYRLIAPVVEHPESLHSSPVQRTPSFSVPHQGDGLAVDAGRPASRVSLVVLGSVFLLAVAWLIIGWPSEEQVVIHSIQPLTSMVGAEVSPAFSPDSRRVAFVAFPDSGGISDIYVQQVGTDTPVRLTQEPGAEVMPAWSPDGQYIIYLSFDDEGCALYRRPSFGGAAFMLRRISCQLAGMAWAPDGGSLVISMYDKDLAANRLYRLDLDDLELAPLTSPDAWTRGDMLPRFSPDGRALAFVRNIDNAANDIYTLPWPPPLEDPERVTLDGENITGFDWAADGKAVIFASGRNASKGLWRMDLHTSKPPAQIHAVTVDDPGSVTIARSGKQLIFTDWTYEINIWRTPVASADWSSAETVLLSTRSDFHPDVSSKGEVAFISTRMGTQELWVSDAAGNQPVSITELKDGAAFYPSWSPDGSQIAFEYRSEGESDIYSVDARGGMPVRITQSEARETRPSWSVDGQAIYFGSNRSGSWQLWRRSLVDGEVIRVTEEGGHVGWESADGNRLLYLRPDTSGVWVKSFAEGTERRLFDADPSFITLRGSGVYYIQPLQHARSYTIMRYDMETDRAEPVVEIPIKPFHYYSRWGFSVSPDERWIYVSQIDKSESDLILTEGVL